MPIDHIIGKPSDGVDVVARGEVLERAHAHEARRHPRQYRARQRPLAEHGLTGGDRGERARGGNAERMHGLAHEIFPQYRAERGAPVAVARKPGSTGSLQLNVAAHAGAIERLPQQDGAAVAELRYEMAELMARISHRYRLRALRHDISGKKPGQRLGVEPAVTEPQLRAESVIESQQLRLGDRHRVDAREETFRQIGVAAAIHGFAQHEGAALTVRPHRASDTRTPMARETMDSRDSTAATGTATRRGRCAPPRGRAFAVRCACRNTSRAARPGRNIPCNSKCLRVGPDAATYRKCMRPSRPMHDSRERISIAEVFAPSFAAGAARKRAGPAL